jgi:hypothetical protein
MRPAAQQPSAFNRCPTCEHSGFVPLPAPAKQTEHAEAGAGSNQDNFLVFSVVGQAGVNRDATGAAFFLFLSALGFFFSRLLLIWPFAIWSRSCCELTASD